MMTNQEAEKWETVRKEAAAVERLAIIWWLRNGDNIGGDAYVACTIADAIEKLEHQK
jgi:hypothetical protein